VIVQVSRSREAYSFSRNGALPVWPASICRFQVQYRLNF
jgi:hypothetical protein